MLFIDIIRKINKYILSKSDKKKIVVLIFMMLLSALFEVIGISMIIPVLTIIFTPGHFEHSSFYDLICRILNIQSTKQLMVIICIAFIIVCILKNIYIFFEYKVQTLFVLNRKFKLQSKLLSIYLSLDYEYFLNTHSGDIIRNINTDSNKTFELIFALITVITQIITVFAILLAVVIANPLIAVIVFFIGFILIISIQSLMSPLLKKKGIATVYAISNAYKWLLQSIQGIKVVKISHKEDFFEKEYTDNNMLWKETEYINSISGKIPILIIESVCMIGVITFLLFLTLKSYDIMKIMPSITATLYAIIKIIPCIYLINTALNTVSFDEEALNKVVETLSLKPHLQNIIDLKKELQFRNEISLSNVTYTYPKTNKKILDSVNLNIVKGQSIGLIGTSGAGKTTTVDLMLGLLNPSEGHIKVDGIDIKDNYFGWLRHIGYIPQNIYMLDNTIKANVAFGCFENKEDVDLVWECLREAQLEDFVRKLPLQLDTEIGEQGVRLSGGQRQRLGIARALYTNPDVLVFDEATSSLDDETEKAIIQSIDYLKGKKTLVIIAHRLNTVSHCDVIYRVENGKIVEDKKLFSC